jgi:hypothetical protein
LQPSRPDLRRWPLWNAPEGEGIECGSGSAVAAG